MTNNMVEFRNVSKTLSKKQVLNEVSLTVTSGEVVGIVGANGSGKTTLLRLVAGLMYPDQGEVWVNGKMVRPGMVGELPVSIGALIETPAFLPHFSGLRNLCLLAGIREIIDEKAVRETIERVGLNPNNKKGVKTYSLGMRQRLGIAQAIMENPNVLLFDEPTNGLDQEGVQLFDRLLQEQLQRGAAVLLVSHVQEDINRFCDKVYLLEDGELKLLRSQREGHWLIVTKNLEDMEIIYQEIPSFEMGQRIKGLPAGTLKGNWSTKEELASFLKAKGIETVEIKEVS